MVQIKLLKFNVLIFLVMSLVSCNKKIESMDVRIEKCIRNSDATELDVLIGGGKKKMLSHSIELDCIIGSKLPTFEFTDLDNQQIKIENLRGKVNVINFWFTQCKLCIKEMPILNTLVENYNGEDINFLALNRDDIAKTKKFLQVYKFNFRIIPNAEETINNKFNIIWGYPLTIVSDRQNKIIGAFRGLNDKKSIDQISKLIEENLR